jgi:hypothetical protein
MSDKKESIFTSKSEAGKGDKPRNISRQYWDNYDQIDWKKKKKDVETNKK